MKPKNKTLQSLGFIALAGLSAPAVHAANDLWVGNTNADFNTLSNWTGSVNPNGNTPQFGAAGSSGTTLNNDQTGSSFAGLTFNSGASAFIIGGNSFTLTGNITNNGANTQTINNAMTSTAVRTFNAASGQLVIGGNFTGANGLTLSGANKITLSGTNTLTTNANFGNLTINGAGGVDITGATTLTGSVGNTFSGYLSVSGGGTTAIKTGGSLTINGTTNASHPNGAVSGGSTISVEGGSFTLGAGTGFALGNFDATAGTLTVTSGTVTINAGTTTDNGADTRFLAMGRDNNSSTGTINLNGGTLASSRIFARDTGTAAGAGTANFVFGGGTLQALANQTDWLASTTSVLNANALALSSVTTTAVSTIDANGFSVGINNAISGAGGFNINSSTGTGTVTFGGAKSYSGGTTVTSGTLDVTGTLADAGAVTVSGGTYKVSNDDTVGVVTLTSGTISNASGKVLTGSSYDVQSGSVSGILGGSGVALTKSTGGTVTLSGANTYTGKTTISGGTLALDSTGSIVNSSEIELNGGNFNVSAVAGYSTGATQALTGSGSITGDITVTGTLAIGNSPGTMTFNDDLTIGSSAISNFQLTDIAFGLGSYDLAQGGAGTQDVTFGGTLNLFFSGGTYANNSTVQIFNFENYFNNFAAVNFSGLGSGQSATFDSGTGYVTVIPEPRAALLGGFGLLALLRRRRN